MNIAVIGTGYVGLVAGACFAETGHDVICVDIDSKKIEALNRGEVPIYEPGLRDLVERNLEEGRIKFSTSLKDGVHASEVIFIAVGTPQGEDGSADLKYVLGVAEEIGRHMNGPKTIVDKSTVPVGTAKLVRSACAKYAKFKFDVVSNPEFLKEGAAIDDFLKPDRVVVGVDNEESAKIMRELYAPFLRTNKPLIVMDVTSAEMTKYTANAMLAVRVSFMNEIANMCERVGADVDAVRVGIGTDSRIGMSFLFPGIGYGGSCFPKDVKALLKSANECGMQLEISKAAEQVNDAQKRLIVDKVKKHFGPTGIKGKRIAIWGLAFKPRTDDVREAPALVIVSELLKLGAELALFDPEAMTTFAQAIGEHAHIRYTKSNYEALQGADALVVCTEWNEFRRPNFIKVKEAMKTPIVFDGRNIFEAKRMESLGFTYYCIGRSASAVSGIYY